MRVGEDNGEKWGGVRVCVQAGKQARTPLPTPPYPSVQCVRVWRRGGRGREREKGRVGRRSGGSNDGGSNDGGSSDSGSSDSGINNGGRKGGGRGRKGRGGRRLGWSRGWGE